MASSCLGDRKQVQDLRFDSHLTGVKKESFLLAHENKSIHITKAFRESKNKFAMSVKKFIRSKLTGAPNENKVQNHLNIAVLNVF